MNATSKIRIGKQRRQARAGKTRSCCGTLNHLAESRGVAKEEKPDRRQVHLDGLSSEVRRYPVAS